MNIVGTPQEYYKQFWDAFKENNLKFRGHWGKFLPPDFGNYVKDLYPYYDKWMKIREEMDPKQVIL